MKVPILQWKLTIWLRHAMDYMFIYHFMRDKNQGVLMKKIPRLISHTHRFYWYSFQNENNLIWQTGGRKLSKID